MAQAVVDALEPIEVDEQHRRPRPGLDRAKQFVGLGTEMKPVGKRGHGIEHAQRMRIGDRAAHLGEQSVNGRRNLGQRVAHNARRGTGEIALFDAEQALAERREGARAFAIGTFGRDVADQQAERPGDDRGNDLGIEFGNREEGGERKNERGETRKARQQGIADFLRRSFALARNRWSPRVRRRRGLGPIGIDDGSGLKSRG